MNTRLDIIRDKQMQNEVNESYITEELITQQNQICNDLFDSWERCIKSHSWNDEFCIGKLKPEYELCIRKRNLMQHKFDSSE